MMENKKHIVAVTALVKYKDKFLILKRNSREIAYPSKWAFPGGKLERGETVKDVLKREIKEETGLDVKEEKEFLGDYTFIRPDGHNVVGFTFLIEVKDDEVRLSNGFEDFKWISPEDLGNFDHIEGMEEDVKKAFRLV